MKLMMTREEVENLLLKAINEKLGTEFNNCDIDTYRYASDFAVLSVVEPEPPKAEEN
jgi:23S rRNA maturation mini-RNase III